MAVSYHEVAVIRARELWMRIALAAVIAAGGWVVTHSPWPAAYLAAVVAVQLVDLWATAPMREGRDPRTPTPTDSTRGAAFRLSPAAFIDPGI